MIPAVMPTYARFDVAFEEGEGPYLFSTDGRRYLDFGAGIAVTVLGHANPVLVRALTDQADKLWHTSNLYRIPAQEELAEKLVANSFADSVFFCNSGAEAVECGLKMVRRYHYLKGDHHRNRVITCSGAFHGRTLATISAGGQLKHLEGFAPEMDGFDHVSWGNLNELRAAITDNTAAILVEPVQGEGGINTPPEDFLRGLRAAADEFGVLLMLDEVQTGVGRTGTLFAHQSAGIVPDVMAVAKGLGGGFPVGACLATEAAASALTAGSHGSTFGGNPLAMAVANAVLDEVLREGFLERVVRVGAALRQGLEDLAARFPTVIAGVKGTGLMLGLACKVENTRLVNAAMDGGLLTVGAGNNVLRLLPPLIIDEGHVEEALDILGTACEGLAGEEASA